MPKETIYGSGLPYGTPDEPGPARSVVELTWSREAEHVQLVTKCVEASTLEVYRPSEGEPGYSEPGRIRGRSTDPALPDFEHDFRDGFYVDLSRDGINRLIRNLRRARDQAFGRDE